MNRRIICITLVIISCLLQTLEADKYTDENRPYEFGFNIEGEQHRHEKKDENGIIMGEFGFITADGVYHVTVYATDENGNFKILSMKNIRTKPYPTAKTGAKQGHSLSFPPSQNPPSTQRPQPKPVSIQPPAKSCSHCSLPPTKPPQLNDLAVVARDQKTYSNGDPYSPLAPSVGVAQNAANPQNYPQKGAAGANNPQTGAAGPNYSRPSVNSQQGVGGPNYSGQGPVGPNSSNQGQQDAKRPNNSQKETGGPNNSQQGANRPYNTQKEARGPNYSQQGAGGPNYSNQGAMTPNYSQQGASGSKYPEQGDANQAEYPGQNLQPPRQGGDRNPKQYNPQSSPSRFGQQNPPDSGLNSKAAPQKPMLISAQMQIVDKNTDIYKKGPGEKEGLPNGLTKDDMKTLLYTFNYTVGFHGHFEEGYTNGAKQGYYFVTGRNGVRTRVDYVADENGFRPKITEEVLDLLSEEVPKPETEKDEKYGLKGYEFKWLYFPSDAKNN